MHISIISTFIYYQIKRKECNFLKYFSSSFFIILKAFYQQISENKHYSSTNRLKKCMFTELSCL